MLHPCSQIIDKGIKGDNIVKTSLQLMTIVTSAKKLIVPAISKLERLYRAANSPLTHTQGQDFETYSPE